MPHATPWRIESLSLSESWPLASSGDPDALCRPESAGEKNDDRADVRIEDHGDEYGDDGVLVLEPAPPEGTELDEPDEVVARPPDLLLLEPGDESDDDADAVELAGSGVRRRWRDEPKSAAWRSPDSMSSVTMARLGASVQTANS